MAVDTVPAPEVETAYSNLTCKDFLKLDPDFVFGTGTSAYQHEGGAAKGGRSFSVWDAFSLRTPVRIANGSNGNEAADMYTRYEEDIKTMKYMGFDAYRFSISWPRILPGGRICLGINKEGIDFYNDIINTLLAHKIEPYVTLFHWDLPYTLEQEYGGFLSDKIVNDFREFAELCFWKFGDRVKYWMTLNEPWSYAVHGYVDRTFPPGKLDDDSHGTSNASSHSYSSSATASAPTAVLHATKTLVAELPSVSTSRILDIVSKTALRKTKRNFIAYRGTPSDINKLSHDPIINKLKNESLSLGSKSNLPDIIGKLKNESLSLGSKSNLRDIIDKLKDESHDLGWLDVIDGGEAYHLGCLGVTTDDSDRANEAYVVAKNLILAHAAAVQSYQKKFQTHQKGKIGITLVSHWFEPFDDKSKEDKNAAKRALDFMLGWFLEPILCGEYPKSMEEYAYENIEPFSEDESKLLKESKIDFLGLNYYTANYAKNDPNPIAKEGYFKDMEIEFLDEKGGEKIGCPTSAPWLFIVPWGIKKLLEYIDGTYANTKYKLPPIYITENGVCEADDHTLNPTQACADKTRINYHRDHLGMILGTMNYMKTKVKGYFAWSWCDNFEWKDGYTYRFGIIYIDYKNNITRHPKDSASWFSKFLEGKKTARANKKRDKRTFGANEKPGANEKQDEEDEEDEENEA